MFEKGRCEYEMENAANQEKPVKNPTYLEHIRYFFDSIDIEHMASVAKMDLGSYDGVKSRAAQIYLQTQSQRMPPEPERRWTKARVETFKNWILNGYPMGEIVQPAATFDILSATPVAQKRMNAKNITAHDVAQLSLAFHTIMDRPPAHPDSYFAVASLHWFPEPSECLHHEPRYNPWHRILIDRFESALRTVPGCENIKLPFWNIVDEIPEFLTKPPFDSYKLPVDVHPMYPKGTVTKRFSVSDIHKNIKDFQIEGTIRTALSEASFEEFSRFIEQAHDDGHVAIGPAMERPDIASFDPIFWFFHCNWERLWWLWQQRVRATDLTKFRATLSSPNDPIWLTTPPFNELPPFEKSSPETIDTSGYSYEDADDNLLSVSRMNRGNFSIERAFRIQKDGVLSVMVREIERLNVPSSFVVHLLGNGKTISKHAIFQSSDPNACENCRKHAKLDVAFRVPRKLLAGKKIEVKIENISPNRIDKWIPNIQVGSPTINVREILSAI